MKGSGKQQALQLQCLLLNLKKRCLVLLCVPQLVIQNLCFCMHSAKLSAI